MDNVKSRSYLLAVDGSVNSNRAVEYLVRRAALLGPVDVHLATVTIPRLANQIPAKQHEVLLQAGSESEHARRMLEAAAIPYRFHGEIGDPADCIVQLAKDERCDEIVMGSRGQSAFDTIALGSVAYRTVRLASVPVTVVPNPMRARGLDLEDGVEAHRVLLCVDGSAADQAAVAYLCALGNTRIPLEIRLFNAQSDVVSGNVKHYISRDVIDTYCRQESAAAMAPAIQALQAAGLRFDARTGIGNAAKVIVREALEQGCTRIVMGTKGRTAIGDVVVGATALAVLHLSEIPITLAK